MQRKRLHEDIDELIMAFDGHAVIAHNRVPFKVLVDTGATDCFADADYAKDIAYQTEA